MKHLFNLVLITIIMAFAVGCSDDSNSIDAFQENTTIESNELMLELSFFDRLYENASTPVIVPNGECLAGAILSAGEQLGTHWSPSMIKYLVELYLGTPQLDYKGELLGYGCNPTNFQLFLEYLFKRASHASLDMQQIKYSLGHGNTAIGIILNEDGKTAHAYNILRHCDEHKPNCYVCYDPVSGELKHIQASEFEGRFTLFLAEPKLRPSSPNEDR